MAGCKQINLVFLFCCVVVLVINSQSTFAENQQHPQKKPSFKPKALILPIAKHASTKQYITNFKGQTPARPLQLTVDLGGPLTFIYRDSDPHALSRSSTYKEATCYSTPCYGLYGGCDDDGSCFLTTLNRIAKESQITSGGLDVISIPSTDGSNVGRLVTLPQFTFSSTDLKDILKGLPKNVKGMAGLGLSKVSLPSQFSDAFGFPKKFALCLPKDGAVGVAFFGAGPYKFPPGIDASKGLVYTPLILNHTKVNDINNLVSDYYIGVNSIEIDGQAVEFDKSLLSLKAKRVGGTKISTLHPYTALETPIYKAFVSAFTKAYANKGVNPMKKPVAPFSLCFSGSRASAAPKVDLVLQNNVKWTISGLNLLVTNDTIKDSNVLCLGIVDGGSRSLKNYIAAITIGGYQLQNRLVQFDLKASQVGLGPHELSEKTKTSCDSIVFPNDVLKGFNDVI